MFHKADLDDPVVSVVLRLRGAQEAWDRALGSPPRAIDPRSSRSSPPWDSPIIRSAYWPPCHANDQIEIGWEAPGPRLVRVRYPIASKILRW